MRPGRWLTAGALLASLLVAAPGYAESSTLQAGTLKPARPLPDVEVTLADGRRVALSSLWSDKPLLVTMFYNRCSGTCSPFLRSLKRAVDDVGGLGDDYRIVTISFDPKDTPADMGARARSLGLEGQADWLIGTAAPDDVRRLSDALGFWYQYDDTSGEFDHPSQVTAVRDARILGVLMGVKVPSLRFQGLVREARGVFVPLAVQPGQEAFVRCLSYDERTGDVRLDWGMLVLLAPGLAAFGLAALLFRRRGAPASPPTPENPV